MPSVIEGGFNPVGRDDKGFGTVGVISGHFSPVLALGQPVGQMGPFAAMK